MSDPQYAADPGRPQRSIGLRIGAIVAVVLVAGAAIIGLQLRDSGSDSAGATIGCPSEPRGNGAVNPTAAFTLKAAAICHYAADGSAGPREAAVSPDQLDRVTTDLNERTTTQPLGSAPGLGVGGSNDESWLLVGITDTGERIQLRATDYPNAYAWDGLGRGLVWYPSEEVRRLLADDLAAAPPAA